MSLLLGMDIGVSSVGYGIVNDDGEAVDAGVRLFSEGTSKDNADRRDRRHCRRTLRRRQHRLVRADRLFVAAGLAAFDDKKNIDLQCDVGVTPYHLRVKGLREPLENKELVIALRHLLKHRGSAPLNAYSDNGDDSGKKDNLSTKSIVAKTKAMLDAGRFVCEIQLERLSDPDVARVRGSDNRFLAEDYAREARQILGVQMQYNLLVTEEFCQAYMGLLETRRAYYEGPGKESPFAWADTVEWMERMMGKCVYTGETRIVKRAPTAELFNLLNDLNNMLIDGEHITREDKVLLVEKLFFKQVSSPAVKKVLALLGKSNSAHVTGLRINGSNKQIFTELKGWHYINNANIASDCSFDMGNLDKADEIARILTVYQDKKNAVKALSLLGLTEGFIEELVRVYDSSSASIFKGTHSLSRSAIMQIIDDLWETSKNQMQLFTEKGMKPQHTSLYVRNGRIMPEIVNDMAVSAVARRAISQTFTVFNDLLDKYPQGFMQVTVRMAWEQNSDAQKKFIAKMQSANEQMNAQVREVLQNRSCDGRLFDKVKLWLLQDGKDIYTGDAIPIEQLISQSNLYEVDYIIPISISFDSSFNNKALTSFKNNQAKGQRTPYQWMLDTDAPDFGAFALRVMEIKDSQKMSQKKRNNLLFKEDTNKWEVRSKFINRNLVDTRYACKEVVYALRECVDSSGTNVHTVNGSFVHYLRKLWGLNKDRSADYSHNAIDALIAAASPLVIGQLDIVKNFDIYNGTVDGSQYVVNRKTGEVIDDDDNLSNAIYQFKRFGSHYSSFDGFKYSHKIDKKKIRGLCNDTLYSTRVRPADGREWKLGKIKNLYDAKLPVKYLQKFFEAEPEKLLLYESDLPSFMKLKEIYDGYLGDGKVNPFALYFRKHGYVTKHSPAGNGPAIKSLKFYDAPVGDNPFDLTHKFNCKSGKRVIMEGLSTYRVDVYKGKNGYRIVRISMSMASGSTAGKAQWEREKIKQKIGTDDVFLFSLYKNDLFKLNGELYRFCGYSGGYQILVQYVDSVNQTDNGKAKMLSPYIGPRTLSVEKVYSNSLGVIC